jgi:FkbM family methyltransferase
MLRELISLPVINPALMGALRLMRIDSSWIRSRFFRVGPYKRDGIWFIGRNWDSQASVYWDGALDFEPEMSKLFHDDIRPGMTVLDVGANVGYYSLLAASKGGGVFAFEPSTKTRALLLSHLALNNFDVTVIPMAMSDSEGFADLHFAEGDETDTGASLDPVHGSKKSERVRVSTIDRFVDFYGMSAVDVIKIDVERLEPKVLAGAARTIRRFRPIIYCEVLPLTDKAAIEDALPGYQFQHLTDHGPLIKEQLEHDPTRRFRNYRFVPRNQVASRLGSSQQSSSSASQGDVLPRQTL